RRRSFPVGAGSLSQAAQDSAPVQAQGFHFFAQDQIGDGRMSTSDCLFCRKLGALASLPPEEVVWQFPHAVVLLGAWQYYTGYCVVVARRHASELSQLGDDERRAYLDEMCLVARAIEQTFRPLKMNYELLGNQVPHLHWHLFPRRADDPETLKPVWL